MAILQLTSNNPKFSYVIVKNPNSNMLIKNIRYGKLFGWFTDPQKFNCYFKDADNEVSYKSHPDESFEFVSTCKYNSAMFVINTISDYFHTAYKILYSYSLYFL